MMPPKKERHNGCSSLQVPQDGQKSDSSVWVNHMFKRTPELDKLRYDKEYEEELALSDEAVESLIANAEAARDAACKTSPA